MKKKVIWGLVILVALVGVVSVLIFFLTGSNKGHADDDAEYGSGASIFCVDTSDEVVIYVDEKPVHKLDSLYRIYRNGDSNVCYITEFKNKVHILLKDKVKTIEVDKHIEYIYVSEKSVEALLVDEDDNVYYCDGEKLEKITSNDPENWYISADGESYAYSWNTTTYYAYCGNRARVYYDCIVGGIADDGTYINVVKGSIRQSDPDGPDVWYEGGEDIIIDKDGNEKKDENAIKGNFLARANNGDRMYVEQQKTYVVKNNGEKIKVLDGIIYETLHHGRENLETLEGLVCYSRYPDAGYVMTKDYKLKKLTDDCYRMLDIDGSGNKVLYLNSEDELCVIEDMDSPKTYVLNEDTREAEISPDGKSIYYMVGEVYGEKEFHYVDEEYNDKKVFELNEYSDCICLDKGYYITADNVNYFIVEGEAKKLEQQGQIFTDRISGNIYCYNSEGVYRIENERAVKLEGDIEGIEGVMVAE